MLGRHLDDDAYRALQLALAMRQEQGTLIPGSGGLRKLRWARTGRGKSSGLSVIYYWVRSEEAVYLLHLYAKAEVSDLTKAQIRDLSRLVRQEFK